ncbi:MAG: ABC transporter ATP-binding protein/permease [Thermodesulfovibrionales bacterium]|nr:ABC transporter ATP-binding protein/permease [Thermodesulfovibrionales bacterium]
MNNTSNRVFEVFQKYKAGDYKDDVKTLFCLAKPYVRFFIIAVLCSSALSGINGLIAWGIQPALDMVFSKKSTTVLTLIPLGVIILFLLRGIFVYTTTYLMNSIGARIAVDVRETIYNRLVKLPISFHTTTPSGTVMSRMLNDVGLMQAVFANTVRDLVVEGATAIVLLCVAFYRRWDLALLSFIVIPAILLSIAHIGKILKRISLKTRVLISDVTITLQETLQGIKIIKAFTIEEHMRHRFKNELNAHYNNTMKEVKVDETSRLLAEVLGGIGVSIILVYGGHLILTDSIQPSTLFSFIAAILLVYTPLKRLSKVHNGFQQIRTVFQKIKELLLIDEEKTGGIRNEIKGNIRFEGVYFSYPGTEDEVLKDINFEVKEGEIVALVGYSGAGKTTIVDLVGGFWFPTKGSVKIDNIDTRDIDLAHLRGSIGLVSQDVVLFDDTVKANILLGNKDATEDEVIEAAKSAYAHDFIMELPDGYNTIIGERGARLSGGQKQRITIARAILKNPKILLLDEATSSLDTESEQKVQSALEKLMSGRTTLVIAHRLSTVQISQKIIVLNKGVIEQIGTHEELIRQGGTYTELYNLQFGSKTNNT